jgi:hypothetical protein
MELIVAALATWQIVEIWHHSSLFAGWRAIVENWESKIGELLSCPFCLSPYVAAFCCGILYLPTSGLAVWLDSIGAVAKTGIYAFAVARLANLGNDYFHASCRTPRFTLEEFFEDTKEENVKSEFVQTPIDGFR